MTLGPKYLVSTMGGQLDVGKHFIDQDTLNEPPLAPKSLIFFTQAVVQVGRATDADWTDWERSTLNFPKAVSAPIVTPDDILSWYSPPRKPVRQIATLAGSLTAEAMHARYERELAEYDALMEIWNAAEEKRQNSARERALADWNYYSEWKTGESVHAQGAAAIVRASRTLFASVVDPDGVTPYYRSVAKGGEAIKMNRALWADETLPAKVARNGIFVSGDQRYYLFVDRAELEEAFPTDTTLSSVFGVAGLSPSMQLMAFVIRKLGIQSGTRIKSEAIKNELEKSAPLFGLSVGSGCHITPRDIVTMAKILQSPLEK